MCIRDRYNMTLSTNPEARKKSLANLKPNIKREGKKGAGRPKGSTSLSTDIMRCINSLENNGKIPKREDGTPLYTMAQQLISIALSTSTGTRDKLKALDMIFDRVEGKPTQKIEQTNEDVTPDRIELVAVDVDKKEK